MHRSVCSPYLSTTLIKSCDDFPRLVVGRRRTQHKHNGANSGSLSTWETQLQQSREIKGLIHSCSWPDLSPWLRWRCRRGNAVDKRSYEGLWLSLSIINLPLSSLPLSARFSFGSVGTNPVCYSWPSCSRECGFLHEPREGVNNSFDTSKTLAGESQTPGIIGGIKGISLFNVEGCSELWPAAVLLYIHSRSGGVEGHATSFW